MPKAPAFQFYPKDWFDRKVLRMDYYAQGVYWRLLCHMWTDSKNQCSISSDARELAKVLSLNSKRFESVISQIQWENDPLLVEKEGMYISKRLQRVKREQVKRFKQAKKAGEKGARNRWGSHSDPNGDPTDPPMAKDSPSPSTSSSPSTSPPGGGGTTPRSGRLSRAEELDRLVAQAERDRIEKLTRKEPPV